MVPTRSANKRYWKRDRPLAERIDGDRRCQLWRIFGGPRRRINQRVFDGAPGAAGQRRQSGCAACFHHPVLLLSMLRLDQFTCSTPDMVAKEIEMGIAAYNLVRAMIGLAAYQSGNPPRGYSSTKVRRIVEAFAPSLANAPDPQAARRIFDQMTIYVQESRLPRRNRNRPSRAREVWQREAHFPSRKK